MPIPVNETCRGHVIGLESYAIDVAQIEVNFAIVRALENARLELLDSEIDPSCFTIIDWTICFFRFPPCVGTKLMLPCTDACPVILSFFAICFDAVQKLVDDKEVRNYFQRYRCRLHEAYYEGYDKKHFVNNPCVDVPIG